MMAEDIKLKDLHRITTYDFSKQKPESLDFQNNPHIEMKSNIVTMYCYLHKCEHLRINAKMK